MDDGFALINRICQYATGLQAWYTTWRELWGVGREKKDRFPAGPRVRLKTIDPPKGNGEKKNVHPLEKDETGTSPKYHSCLTGEVRICVSNFSCFYGSKNTGRIRRLNLTVPFTFRRLEGGLEGGLQGALPSWRLQKGRRLEWGLKRLTGPWRGHKGGLKGLEGGTKGAWRGLEGRDLQRGLQGGFKGASRELQGVSRGLQGSFKEASRWRGLEGGLKGAWRGLQGEGPWRGRGLKGAWRG